MSPDLEHLQGLLRTRVAFLEQTAAPIRFSPDPRTQALSFAQTAAIFELLSLARHLGLDVPFHTALPGQGQDYPAPKSDTREHRRPKRSSS